MTLPSRKALLLGALALDAALFGLAQANPPAPYQLKVHAPDVQVGKPGSAQIDLVPQGGMHVNTEYPTAMKLEVPAGVDAPAAASRIKPSKIERTGAHFDVGFTAKDAGAKTFTATVSFVVCNDANTQCDPRKEQVKFTVNAK